MSPSGTGDWQIEKLDAERRQEMARKSMRNADMDGRSWTGWKVTLGIIALVAGAALVLNFLVGDQAPYPYPTPTASLG